MDDSQPSNSPSSPNLHQMAIDAALSCRWEKAIELNEELIKTEPTNTACLNRLARALFEMGKYSQAKKLYQEVLQVDPYNVIAQKNLKKLASFKKGDGTSNGHLHSYNNIISASLFLEEPGMTKIVSLIKTAEPQKLSTLSAGMLVNIVKKNRGLCATDFEGNYLGILPDDLAHHLARLMKGGNKYQALIKSVKSNGVAILIREVFRSRRFRNQPSFLDTAKVMSFSSDHITLNTDEERAEDEANEEPEEFEAFPR